MKGCLWIAGIVVGLGLLGFIYFTLNPPLGNSETGYLSASRRATATLSTERPVAAFRLRVAPSPGIYTAQRFFDPLLVTASLAAGSDPAAVLRIYPTDANPVRDLRMTDDGRSAAWHLQCDDPPVDPRGEVPGEAACPREYLVVVAASVLDGNVDVGLELFAEQTFPEFLDTPFLVSIGLGTNEIELPADARFLTGVTSGSVHLSATGPVANYRLLAGDSGAGEAGTVLTVSAERSAEAVPAGLRAPAPVRVAVIDPRGAVVADVGVRPGTSASVGLPRLLGAHQLIAWWQDRADQDYDVTWTLEQGRVGAGQAPTTTISGPTLAPMGEEIPAQGSVVVGTEDGRTVPLGLSPAPGVTSAAGRLAARLGVLSLAVEVEREDAADMPVVVYLAPSGGYERERVPIVVRPGEATQVVAAVPDCASSACSSWDLVFGAPAEGERQMQVRLTWQGVLRLWPLSSAGSAL